MRKGFTLMEILAVLLVIALVASLALPVLRAVRYEVRNSQAKAATLKLAEAVKTYYNVSRGYTIAGCFTPTTSAGKTLIKTAATACTSPAATGIPNRSATPQTTDVKQLFACGYLTYKDFAGIPYTFCPKAELPSGVTLTEVPSDEVIDSYLARSYGYDDKAGAKYQKTKGYIYVDAAMKAKDSYDHL